MPQDWSRVKLAEDFWGDLSRQTRRLLKQMLEGTMEVWRDEWVGVDWHAPSDQRGGYRNGYYTRKRWATPLGMLEEVRVPRCRQAGLTNHMLERLDHHADALGDSVVEMLLAGVSTRRVGELLERIIDLPVSAGQVSRLAKRLDAEVGRFHTRPLEDHYCYLLLDAIHLKARATPRLFQTGLRRTRARVVLVAYGITAQGGREIIDFRIANAETTQAWERFLLNLYRRGLCGESLRLITTDGGGGVIGGVEAAYPHVPRQRCWFHKMQNVAAQVRKRDRRQVLRGLREVYAASHRRAAVKAYGRWGRRWRHQYPKAVGCVDRDLDALLAAFDLPAGHRKTIRTTNPIERAFREVRRRTRPIGTFVNDASIERIVYGLIAYMNGKFSRLKPTFKENQAVA